MNITDLQYRHGSHDDQTVFKELVEDDMYQFQCLAKLTELYTDWSCIDGGGHIGIFSLLLNKHIGGEILTYEPNPDSFYFCKLNTKAFGNITVYPKALDTKEGSFNLYPPKNISDTGSWSMAPTTIHDKTKGVTIETVNIIEVLTELANKRKNILLKLDLEGYEANIIEETPADILQKVKLLILEEHHQPINHQKLFENGFRLLFHPANSRRHFVYYNVSQESPLIKEILNIKCNLGDKYYDQKIGHLIEQSRISPRRIIAGVKNKILKNLR